MDEDQKQKVMIGVIVGCIVLAGVIFFVTREGGGGSKRSTGDIPMLCVNPDCYHEYDLEREEYTRELLSGGGGGPGGPPMMGAPVLTCPECQELSAYRAIICKKCEVSFVQDFETDDFPDRCPECDYSEIEEKRKALGR